MTVERKQIDKVSEDPIILKLNYFFGKEFALGFFKKLLNFL